MMTACSLPYYNRFVSLKYLRHAYGMTQYRFTLCEDSSDFCASCDSFPALSSACCGSSSSPEVLEFVAKKAAFVLHMIEVRVGKDEMQQTIRQMQLGGYADGTGVEGARRGGLQLSSRQFFKMLRDHAGVDAKSFISKWVSVQSVPRLRCGYMYDKRNHSTEMVRASLMLCRMS